MRFKLHSKHPKFDKQSYDEQLSKAIEHAKYDYEKARKSETAMFESDIAPRMIKAETARAKQKYFFTTSCTATGDAGPLVNCICSSRVI